MRTIWKYSLGYPEPQVREHALPRGAKVRHVAIQPTAICLWVEVDPDAPKELRTFHVIGTGHALPAGAIEYLGTVHHDDYVWHVLEEAQ